MRLSIFISVLSFLFLSGCASQAAYQQQMLRWQGKSVQALKREWGQPDSVIKLPNGHILYQYTRKSFVSIPDPKRQPFKTNTSLFTSYDQPWLTNQTMVRYCRSTFEANRCGTIIRTSSSGNNCVAYRFFR